jgi:succinate dehydrogenase/fumarate reductase cytochrome b subunit
MSIQGNTSEMNILDDFVHHKINTGQMMYRFLCASMVTLVALRLNSTLDSVSKLVVGAAKVKNKMMTAIIELSLTLVFVIIFAAIFRIMNRIRPKKVSS